MKRISTAVLGAALVTGMAGLTIATPAIAKKKEEAKGPSYTQAVALAANKAKAAFAAKDMAAAEAATAEAEAAVKMLRAQVVQSAHEFHRHLKSGRSREVGGL